MQLNTRWMPNISLKERDYELRAPNPGNSTWLAYFRQFPFWSHLLIPELQNTVLVFFYFPPVEPVISHKSASVWSGVKTSVMQEMSLWPMFRLRGILYKVWSRKWFIALSCSRGSSLKVCRSVKFLKCHTLVLCSTFLFTRFIGCADKGRGRLVTAT